MRKSRKPPLRYISEEQEGITRLPWGRGFTYRDHRDNRITDKATLERIKSLVIPPAWRSVWICPEADGYLQAVGRDEKGRKQYIYHPEWVAYRQKKKFDRIVEFAENLPLIRRVTREHLRDKTWTKRKVMALVLMVMDETAIRIGNKVYKERNNTFGLTTLRRKHLKVSGRALRFSFKGKSNQYREVEIENKKLIRLIKDCSELPGYEIFRYQDAEGNYQIVDSQDVNEYLQVISGKEFSSKDFRTWYATATAVERWPEVYAEYPGSPRDKMISALVKKVAGELGNTVSVCRNYYIHPKILTAFEKGTIEKLPNTQDDIQEDFRKEMEEAEQLAFQLIKTA